MKYDSIIQFSRLANEIDENGKMLCTVLREFFKNMEIKQGTMHKAVPITKSEYCIRAKTTLGEDIEIIRIEDNVSVKVSGENKKIQANIFLNEKMIITSGHVFDNTGVYLFDSMPQENTKESGNVDFVASYYDNEVLEYFKQHQESPEMIKNKVPGKTDTLSGKRMLSKEQEMDNSILRKVLLDEGILPDDEIRKEVISGENVYLSTSMFINNPSEIMNENREQMTR